jgi:hypothetical protein
MKNEFVQQTNIKEKKNESKKSLVVTDDKVFESVRQLILKKSEFKTLETEIKALDTDVRETVLNQYSSTYQVEQANPGTLQVEFKNTKGEVAEIILVPTDTYCDINEATATKLKDVYGENVVTTKDKILVDNEMYKKYQKQIVHFLEKNKHIADEDRKKIIRIESAYCVAKGTHNRLSELALKTKSTVKEVLKAIGVIFRLQDMQLKVVNEPEKVIQPTVHEPRKKTLTT